MQLFFSGGTHGDKYLSCRVHPSKSWIESQVPEIVKIGVEGLREDVGNLMETDVEALVQAYINIVAGACISLGNIFFSGYAVLYFCCWNTLKSAVRSLSSI